MGSGIEEGRGKERSSPKVLVLGWRRLCQWEQWMHCEGSRGLLGSVDTQNIGELLIQEVVLTSGHLRLSCSGK